MRQDVSDADYQALAGFRRQLRSFIAFSEEAARAAGLEPRQHQLLLAVRGMPPGVEPSVQVLSEHLALRHHTVVELIDRLEDSGLVRRERARDDRRRARIVIQPRGAQMLRKLSKAHLEELGSLAPALVASLEQVLTASTRAA